MRRFDGKAHTKKYLDLSKAAGRGAYPSKKAAKVGSTIGLGVGGALLCAGLCGLAKSAVFGMGSFAVGALTVASNVINLKRIGR